ncbi:MAG: C-GCAxxG-C-C family protein [Anaerolineae bacterium]
MLLTVGEHVLDNLEPRCARMATGLAGGVGDTQQEMCGALSGGVLVIGGLLGRTRLSEDDRPALDLATRYRARFLEELVVTQCARLREMVHAPGGLGSCASLVERAATILLELLAETVRIRQEIGPNP